MSVASYYLIEKYFVRAPFHHSILFLTLLGAIAGTIIMETNRSPSLKFNDTDLFGDFLQSNLRFRYSHQKITKNPYLELLFLQI